MMYPVRRSFFLRSVGASVAGGLIGCFFLVFSSCATFVPPPEREAPEAAAAEAAWARVLAKNVDKQGRVNFTAVAKSPADLESYVSYVAKWSPAKHPEHFKEPGAALAFYLNSYNALAMYGVIKAGIPADFDGFFKRASFFTLRKYLVGGEQTSLYTYENSVIRPLKEPRVHFALNCMSVGCPRLPQVPYRAATLEKQLEDGAKEFFNQEKYLQVDAKEQVYRISEILKFYTGDFVNERVATSLAAYANRYRTAAKIPETDKVEFLKYDWTVNRQP